MKEKNDKSLQKLQTFSVADIDCHLSLLLVLFIGDGMALACYWLLTYGKEQGGVWR
jgi:hypothetical protein